MLKIDFNGKNTLKVEVYQYDTCVKGTVNTYTKSLRITTWNATWTGPSF